MTVPDGYTLDSVPGLPAGYTLDTPSVSDPNDVIKSYGGGLERGGAAMAMILPNLLNQAVVGPQELYRGATGREHDNSPMWQPFYSSEDALKALPDALQPHVPTTTGGRIADFSGQLMGNALAGVSPKAILMDRVAETEPARLGKILTDNNVPTYLSDVLPEGSNAKSTMTLMGDLPLAGKAARASAQQEGLNTAIAKQMGMDSPIVNPPLMEKAADQAGDVFKYVGDNYNVGKPQTAKLFNDLAPYQTTEANVDPVAQANINKQLNNLLNGVDKNGEIPGSIYSSVRSDLGRLARKTTDPDVEQTAYAIQKHLDEAISPSISPEMQKVFSQNRGYYRNMLATEPAVKSAMGTGNIKPTALEQGVSKIYPNYIYNDPASMPQLTQGAQLLNSEGGNLASLTPLQRFVKQYGWGGDVAQGAMLAGSPVLGPMGRMMNPKLSPADFNAKSNWWGQGADLNHALGRALMATSVSPAGGKN